MLSRDITNARYEPDHRCLTAFVCDTGELYQFTRMPFGMRSSGCTFVSALKLVLQPFREFTQSYVDAMAVHSGKLAIISQPISTNI